MCGIVGAVAQRDVQEILVEGLRRLEYRGYDSAGVAICQAGGGFTRLRAAGKVSTLAARLAEAPVAGGTGIAHTRWATHGAPTELNAHPHDSRARVLVVHNGIVENHAELRVELIARGARFTSDTDTEVIAHLVVEELERGASLLEAVARTKAKLKGSYGAVVMDVEDPDRLVGARSGSPLVVGVGVGEYFLASDPLALFPVTRRFIYLEEGELVEITRTSATIYSPDGEPVKREARELLAQADAADKGQFRHYMQKEIFEQPRAVQQTLEGRLTLDPAQILGDGGAELVKAVERVQIIACGTSYHAGLTARYWFEGLADLPCDVEIASEFRYRHTPRPKNALLIVISQSGETADTLAALRQAAGEGYLATLAICNVANSSLVREAGRALLTRAGTEIGVASTKAFTTQLAALATVVLTFAKVRGGRGAGPELVEALSSLPGKLEQALALDSTIETLAEEFANKHHALFLGRGEHYPIAMEGALKLKEISYIHAEAYAAGELKHGPLALIDAEMPVIVIAPNDQLLEKLKSNIEEVRARGGILYVFADINAGFKSDETLRVINLPHVDHTIIAPMVYTVALQLLSYHVAVIRGTDVDQPRNLAKSVTVE